MVDVTYVILIDGWPYREEFGAIRTYTSREQAEDKARALTGHWAFDGSAFGVGVFSAVDITPVITEEVGGECHCPASP